MATNNSTFLDSTEVVVTNLTDVIASNQTFSEKLASLPVKLFEHRGLLLLETRIVFASLACIYIGSHAALRRPHSAKPKKSKGEGKAGGKDDKQEEDEDQYVQGLMPSDALLFPIMAGVVLVGLYYLITWLDDPDIINKILRAYFSVTSLAAMGKLFADTLHLLTGFIFPTVWATMDGKLYHVDPSKRSQWHALGSTDDRVWNDKKSTPFPGPLSELKFSEATNRKLWEMRHLLLESWTVDFWVYGIIREKFQIKLNDLIGIVLAIGASLIYNSIGSVFLSNVMGYAFSYVVLTMLSPTTFGTGSMVLFGLFFYDIYMVFYTPYMVTVATKLDVPIKLVFEGPTRASMLGLGDIVLPGIFIALCLRFDHYMFYHRQRKLVPVELETETTSSEGSQSSAPAPSSEKAATATTTVTTRKTQYIVVKPDYISPQGQWGDRFWSTRFVRMLSPTATAALRASAFPKTYFHAALGGYLLAMLTTLAMLLAFNHAQPALLYLVPGVVAAAWLTGAARRELRLMWAYTEDGTLDTEEVVVDVEVDGNGALVKMTDRNKNEEANADAKEPVSGKEKQSEEGKDKQGKAEGSEEAEKEKEKEGKEKEKDAPKEAKSKTPKAVIHFAIYPPSPLPDPSD